jgi:hypothetical protein
MATMNAFNRYPVVQLTSRSSIKSPDMIRTSKSLNYEACPLVSRRTKRDGN